MMEGFGPEVVFAKASLSLDERFEFKVGIIGGGRGRGGKSPLCAPQLLSDGINLMGGFLVVPGDGF